jgi:hypothetical protein
MFGDITIQSCRKVLQYTFKGTDRCRGRNPFRSEDKLADERGLPASTREHGINANMLFKWRRHYRRFAGGHTHLARCRGDRYALRLPCSGCQGTGDTGTRPMLGASIYLSWPAWRQRQGAVVKWRCLFYKRREHAHFVWPQATSGSVALSQAQLAMLLAHLVTFHGNLRL